MNKEKQIKNVYKAGELVASCHEQLRDRIVPGVSTLELDSFVENYLRTHGATPEQKGYRDYPYATCASVNDEICHGFPRRTPLKDGDLVTIDFVANYQGGLADSAWSYLVGAPHERAVNLLHATKHALDIGIQQAVVGNRVGDIGAAIQRYAESAHFSVVRQFVGHGIGKTIHEPPNIPHYGQKGTGEVLREGMFITIEPMLTDGNWFAVKDDNGWTARTLDESWAAQFEHTIHITKDGPVIVTEQSE
ncbi:methionine aminopeptidase [Pontibacillus halophilus JSM 076056 = DSM 19796]|uniref:Methionine aminopeptidase n=1 Tax=Pontibacillus halophilus JSM 076056 = DSM 19796 TaxID=1385510 RepID=A0A0A5I650_9BACI|nr:type I methionyl aminopeptidase [Pontibacillus halophilus]KGX91307.1 methionine aminopeptidase [Pontibacillus halophilus JSM 076056 = DSM 19796]